MVHGMILTAFSFFLGMELKHMEIFVTFSFLLIPFIYIYIYILIYSNNPSSMHSAVIIMKCTLVLQWATSSPAAELVLLSFF